MNVRRAIVLFLKTFDSWLYYFYGIDMFITVNRLDSVVLTPPHPPPSPGQLHFSTNTTCHWPDNAIAGFQTLYWPYTDPISTQQWPHIFRTSVLNHPHIDPRSTLDRLWYQSHLGPRTAYFRTEKYLPLFLNDPHNDHTWIESCNLFSNKGELKGVKKKVKLENQ